MTSVTRPSLSKLGIGARHQRKPRLSDGRVFEDGRRRYVCAAILRSTPALLAVISLMVVGPVPTASSAAGGEASPVPCPTALASNQCVSVTPSGCTISCPTATVGPTSSVAPDAYVYLSLTGFPAGDWASIHYCPVSESASGPDPVCADGIFEGITFQTGDVKILPDGSGVVSYQVTSDPSGEGTSGIPGVDVQGHEQTTTPFFCDNGADPCALQITDIGQGTNGTKPVVPDDTAQNTIVVPLTFAVSTSGCPSSDPIVNTEGAFSVEQFLPSVDAATCGEPNGIIDVNTSIDTESAVSDFAQGNTALAFTDYPNDPVQLQALSGIKYMFIPVAASASVVSFLSASSLQLGNSEYAASPQASYNLTPNMTAGLITSAYSSSYGSDVLVPPLKCKDLGCKNNQNGSENTFDLLNPTPSGFVGPSDFLSSFPSVATGASDEITGWMCSMPNVALSFQANKTTFSGVIDKNTATKTLETDVTNKQPWPFTTCTNYPTIPTVGTPAGTYQPAQTPANQAVKIRTEWAGGTLGPSPVLYGPQAGAGFGAMDWGDAAFFGLDAASLQNAAGNFVAPSQTSIDAALGDAGTVATPGGPVLSDTYTTSDPAAYPTPTVSYAVLSLAPQSGDQVVDETDLLTNLVNYSHSPTGIPLPGGYVPLPNNLYTQAMNDIVSARATIVETSPPTPRAPANQPAPAASPGSSPKPTHPTLGVGQEPQSELTTAAGLGTGQMFVRSGTVSPASGVPPVPIRSRRPPSPSANRGFVPTVIALVAGSDRLLLPVLVGAMVAAWPAGMLVLLGVRFRRRQALRKIAVERVT
jgi:hypothetical protein